MTHRQPLTPHSQMPIYEFYSPDNHRIYSFLARTLGDGKKTPRCPDNPKFKMERRISRFAIIKPGAAGEEEDDTFAGIDEARLAALMEDMEGDLGGLDEDNPNPHQLGKLMRKFGSLLGGNASAGLDEMIRRLEAGEDPKTIEEEMGDVLDDEEMDLGKVLKKLTTGFRPPSRDPVLYEMREYV